MPHEYLGNADGVSVEADERGFELHFGTDQGSYIVNIHGCWLDLLHSVEKMLKPFEFEMEDARRTYVPPAGGMTAEEIRDVYKDHPGKRYSMLEELEGGHRPW